MKTVSFLLIATTLLAQTTSRPVSGLGLQGRQMSIANLANCTSASPCKAMVVPGNAVVDTGDIYIGQSLNGTPNAGQIGVGSAGSVTLVIKDGNGIIWVNATFTAATTGVQNNPLGGIIGLFLARGMSVYCSDSNSGASCAASNLQIYWQR